MRGSRGGGGRGSGPSPQNIGFLSNTGSDPLENQKTTKPAFNVRSLTARERDAI